MPFLATKTIKAPTLYTTDTDSATAFKTAVDTLIAERDALIHDKEIAKVRAEVITKEIGPLKRQLSATVDKTERASIKAAIATLEAEQEDVLDTLSLDVGLVLEARAAELSIPTLKAEAQAEHDSWFIEIREYEQSLRKSFHESIKEIIAIRTTNAYDVSNRNLDGLERFIADNRKTV
jgi:hypothetical protein